MFHDSDLSGCSSQLPQVHHFCWGDIRGVCFHCVTSGCHIVLNSVVSLRWCLLDLSIVKARLSLCSFVIICRMIIWDWDPHPPFGSIHWDPCPSQLLWISGCRMVMSWRFCVKFPTLPIFRGHHCMVYNALPPFFFLMLKWSQNSWVEPHSRWFLCPFEHVPIRHLALPRFLVTDASGSSWPFLAPDLSSAFSPRGFLLSREWYLETKIWRPR